MLARADIPEEFRVPCHTYIDEYHNFVSDSLEETFAEGRKYKTYLTVATQVIGQGMTTEMQKNIFGNVNVKLIGKAGYESREMMMKQMGFNEKYTRKKGITKYSFTKLKKGKFIAQVDIANPKRIKNRKKTLGNKRSMSEKKWLELLEKQKERYYVKPFQYASVKNVPKDPFEDSIKEEQIRNINYKEKLQMSPSNKKQR